jgi:hypothetical protein
VDRTFIMTKEEMIFFAFLNKCQPLLKLLQTEEYSLIDVSDDSFTILINKQYFIDNDFSNFVMDMDDTTVVNQIVKAGYEHYMRIYKKCQNF